MDIVFGQLHLLMLGTELEAVPADTVSFELCIYSYLRASCVHSDRVCRLYSFIINVLLLFECHWSHSLQILLHVRNICNQTTIKILHRLSHTAHIISKLPFIWPTHNCNGPYFYQRAQNLSKVRGHKPIYLFCLHNPGASDCTWFQ